MENIHAGHRERMKNRYRQHGLSTFTDVEALEILLFYALPRRNTNELAHALLARFQDFRGVMDADIREIAKVKGIGENAATLIKLVTELNHRYLSSERKNKAVIDSSEAAGEYLIPLFSYQTEETVFLLCLDSAGRVSACHNLATGSMNKVDFAVRDVVSLALADRAVGVILAHNHVNGTALPSNEDLVTTRKIAQAVELVGVELRDHIIVCDDDFVSMRDSGFLLRMR